MRRKPDSCRRHQRRAAVVVQVAVLSTVIIGMAALAVDIGAMYTARTELQAAVDSAALAAAAQLVGDSETEPADLAREAADEYARLNAVFGTYAGVDPNSDVEFGRASYNAVSGKFEFEPAADRYDAVRITVRRTSSSEGGALQLGFANIFGYGQKDLWARASAVLIPRDIAVVIDLSGSMSDDSELAHYKTYTSDLGQPVPGVEINLRDIWCALDGPEPSRPYVPGGETETEYAGDTGPTIGVMSAWGNEIVPDSYDPTTDAALWRIPKSSTCTVADASASLSARGYSADEINWLLSGSKDSAYSSNWRNRASVIVGLASWKSGRPGGFAGGDGDFFVENSELTYNSYPTHRRSWSWSNFVDYVGGTSAMTDANSNLRYRFGLKTYTNFLLENKALYSQTWLYNTPQQPLRAVKDAVQAMTDVIVGLDSLDHMSLETFATSATHEVDLSDNLQAVPDRLYVMQASHYNSTTNIGAAIGQAMNELTSPRARGAAAKVIVLMSDGRPNVDESGMYVSGVSGAVYTYVRNKAQDAADAGMRIYTVSVGADVDTELMAEIASIAKGQHFHAEGTPDEYADQLEDIFRSLGGKRPVALIE